MTTHTIQTANEVRTQLLEKQAIINQALALLDSVDNTSATLNEQESAKVEEAAVLRDSL